MAMQLSKENAEPMQFGDVSETARVQHGNAASLTIGSLLQWVRTES